ncbi:MAG TPA: hypothetical protein VHU13_06540 [Solirubrobacteraceae bacterium]|jgi:hypothetical protein|nr:hypothetical protein [Solirubrobacteraceae bacterium]
MGAVDGSGGACWRCTRRAWLLDCLSPHLNLRARDCEEQLLWLLALSDEALIEALGGAERERLRAQHRDWRFERDRRNRLTGPTEVLGICRHHCAYPQRLLADGLTWGPRGCAWRRAARVRTLALIADLTVVVQASARNGPPTLAGAGRDGSPAPGAVPDGADSPAAAGSDLKIRPTAVPRALEAPLAGVLERVLNGADTVDSLRADGETTVGLELALTELELRGLLRRSLGGRYLPGDLTGVA